MRRFIIRIEGLCATGLWLVRRPLNQDIGRPVCEGASVGLVRALLNVTKCAQLTLS